MILAVEQLWQALARSAEDSDCAVDLVAHDSVNMGSGCIVDHWHRFTVQVSGFSSLDWLDGLDADAVYVSGFVLAQLEVGPVEIKDGLVIAEIEGLTAREA